MVFKKAMELAWPGVREWQRADQDLGSYSRILVRHKGFEVP